MPGIFKAVAMACVMLAMAGSQAHAQNTAESKALAAWPDLAKRDGKRLLVLDHGGGEFSGYATVFVDGRGDCRTHRFAGVQKLFDTYTRRLEPVAELLCETDEGVQRALVRADGSLMRSHGRLTASADGHYVFVEQQPEHGQDDQGKPIDYGLQPSIWSWTAGGGGGGPYALSCTESRPDGPSDFRATCTDAASGRTFAARFGDAHPDKDYGYRAWKVYNLDDPSDGKTYLNPTIMIPISNGGDRFNLAAREAKALAEHPGLVRRDGPDLVVLDDGRDGPRIRDKGECDYWYFGRSIDLYDARTGKKAPVAEIYCHRGEFHLLQLAPPYAAPLLAPQGYQASADGKTVAILYGSTEIVDWQSRKVLLRYPHPCTDLAARGNDHFSGRCTGPQSDSDRYTLTVDFDRDARGVWTVTESPKPAG